MTAGGSLARRHSWPRDAHRDTIPAPRGYGDRAMAIAFTPLIDGVATVGQPMPAQAVNF
jgi:hypothetical protein